MICVGLAGSALFSFNKGDDRNFQIAKNLDIFNAIFKELDMFYVDTIDPEKVIKYGIDAMLAQTDRKSTRLNSSHLKLSRMPSSA